MRLEPADRLDAAHAAGDGRVREQPERADLAGARDVRAAAQLAAAGDARLGHALGRDQAHLGAVLLAEQHHRARAAFASPMGITAQSTGRSASIQPLTRSSMRGELLAPRAPRSACSRSAAARARPASPPGARARPARARSAACSRCVAVWWRCVGSALLGVDLRRAARRRRRPPAASSRAPSPAARGARWTRPRGSTWVSAARTPVASIAPWSATCPPPSGVDRRAVEHQLQLLAARAPAAQPRPAVLERRVADELRVGARRSTSVQRLAPRPPPVFAELAGRAGARALLLHRALEARAVHVRRRARAAISSVSSTGKP